MVIVKNMKKITAILLVFTLLFSYIVPVKDLFVKAATDKVTVSVTNSSSIVLGKSKNMTINLANNSNSYLYNVGLELILEPGITYENSSIEPSEIREEKADYSLNVDGRIETVKKTRHVLVWHDVKDLAKDENYSFEVNFKSDATVAYTYVDSEGSTISGTQYVDFGDSLTGKVKAAASTDPQLLPSDEDWTNYVGFSTLVMPFEALLIGGGEHLKGAGEFGDLTDANRGYEYQIKIINNTEYQTTIDLTNSIDTEIEIQNFSDTPYNQRYISNNDKQEVKWNDVTLSSNETKIIKYDAAIFNRFTTDVSDPLDGVDDINEGDIIQDATILDNKLIYSGYITDSSYLGDKSREYTNNNNPISNHSIAKDIIIGKSVNGVSGADTSKMKYNDEFVYTIDVSVNGYYDVSNILITDTIGDGQTYKDSSATILDNTYKNGSGTLITEMVTPVIKPEVNGEREIQWNLSEIDFDDNWSRTLTLNTTVDETYDNLKPIVANDSLMNSVDVKGQGIPNYWDTDTKPIKVATDASSAKIKAGKPSISKTVISGDANKLKVRDKVTFEITYTADLGVKQKDVVIRDILPKGLRLIDVSPISYGTHWPDSSKYIESINTDRDIVSWTFNDYLPEDLSTMKVEVTAVVEDDSVVTIDKQDQNLAKLSFKNTEDVVESDRDGVKIAYLGSKLDITKTADKEIIKAGDEVTFTLNVKNTGNASAYDVVVTDNLPAELVSIDVLGDSSISVSGNEISFTIPELAVGETVEKKYKATVANDIGANLAIENLAKIASYKKINGGNDYTDQNKESKVRMNTNSPTVKKELFDSENTSIKSGDWAVYRVTVKVPAGTTAYNPKIEDQLLEVNEIMNVFSGYNADTNAGVGEPMIYTGEDTITVDLVDLANADSEDKEFYYYIKVKLINTLKNNVSFTYSNKETDGNSYIISDSIGSPILKLKEFTPNDTLFADSDDIKSFTVKVENTGENKAYNGVFRVEIPNYLESADSSPSYSILEEDSKKYIQWSNNYIDPGATAQFDFNMKLKAGDAEAGGTGVLTATIVSYSALSDGGKSHTSEDSLKVNVAVANPTYELYVIDKDSSEAKKEIFFEDNEVILRSKVTLPKGTKITDGSIELNLSGYLVGTTKTINIPNDYVLDVNNQLVFDSTERTVVNSPGYVSGITINTGKLHFVRGTKVIQDTVEVGLVAYNITKTVTPLNPVIGEKITYLINVINTGSEMLNNINVVDDMPPYISLNETVNTLNAGSIKTYTVDYGRVLESDLMGLASRELQNTVNSSLIYGESTLTDSATAKVNLQEKHVLQVEKIVDNNQPSTGATVNYTIKVTNISEATINSVVVVDTMLGINENVGSIASGASATVSGSYSVTELSGATITNIANVTGIYKGRTVKVDGQKIIKVNTPPVVGDYSKRTYKNKPVDGNVVGTDIDGDVLTYTKNESPTNGTVTVNSDGSFEYTPDNNYLGEDAFKVEVNDGHGGTAVSTITITVLPAQTNNLPTVPDYHVEMYMNGIADGNVVGIDLNNDTLTYSEKSSPSNGVVSVANNGAWTYTPNKDYIGTDTFTVLVDDSRGGTAISTITIVVKEGKSQITLTADPSKILGDGISKSKLVATVTDNEGNLVSGVKVKFTAPRGSFPSGNEGTTDSNGMASVWYQSEKITETKPVVVRITASVADKEHKLYAEDYIDITFEPVAIRGIVVDNDTKLPVEGAHIVVSKDFDNDGETDFSDEYITGEDGKYIVYVPEGNVIYDVSITKPVLIGDELQDVTFKQKSQVTDITGIGTEVFNSVNTVTGVITLKQPNGNEALLKDYSKYKINVYGKNGEVITNTNASIDKSTGVFHVENLEPGTSYQVVLTMEISEGVSIIAGSIDVVITSDGEINISKVLIDPYGKITDKVTSEVIKGADVKLYYADTKRNNESGVKPDTLVELPIIDFPPSDNHNPQLSDEYGDYAYMVFPNTDYYITAKKDGYKNYTSETISVNLDIVKYDIQMEPINKDKIPNPKTGDDTNILPFLLLSIILPAAIMITRKRYKIKRTN